MSKNTQIDLPDLPTEQITPVTIGVNPTLVVGTISVMALAIVLLGYRVANPSPTQQCVSTQTTLQLQARQSEAQLKLQDATNKGIQALQIKVIDNCVSKGWIPVFAANNTIDCKNTPK